MEVVNSLCNGVKNSTCFSLGEKLLPEDSIQQLPSLHQLRHQVYIPALVIHLTQRQHNPSEYTRQKPTVSESSHINVTDVFQSDDVGVLSISHQDFDLFRGVPLTFVYNLSETQTQY